eukprot:TRINITY_DN2180_c0_g1_i1.p1 TRINITY_DN2180_c0_g1~~TRINITY_DN2180_c0_g1_i1.p1  ORF type:complete len:309 (+),score=38.66 TRINITY_DN2180_c0_g1_i1:50-928(+)
MTRASLVFGVAVVLSVAFAHATDVTSSDVNSSSRLLRGWIQGFHCKDNCSAEAQWISSQYPALDTIYAYCGARIKNDSTTAQVYLDDSLWSQCAHLHSTVRSVGVGFHIILFGWPSVAQTNPTPFIQQSIEFAKQNDFTGYHIDQGMAAKYMPFQPRLEFLSAWGNALRRAGLALTVSEETMLYFHIKQPDLHALLSQYNGVAQWVLLDTYTSNPLHFDSWMKWYSAAIPASVMSVGFERIDYGVKETTRRLCAMEQAGTAGAGMFMVPTDGSVTTDVWNTMVSWKNGKLSC